LFISTAAIIDIIRRWNRLSTVRRIVNIAVVFLFLPTFLFLFYWEIVSLRIPRAPYPACPKGQHLLFWDGRNGGGQKCVPDDKEGNRIKK
jgi:hypothetical protein